MQGRFAFDDLPTGRIAVLVESLGHQSRIIALTIEQQQTVDVVIDLATEPIEMEPISVTVRSRWIEINGFYDRRLDGMKAYVINRKRSSTATLSSSRKSSLTLRAST